jgi:AraC-like DNA-binding protein
MMMEIAGDPYVGNFDVHSRDAIARHLKAFGANWNWAVLPVESGDYCLQLSRQPLQSAFIVYAAHSSGFKATATHDISRVCIIFMLAGAAEVYDRRSRQTLNISANQVAVIRSLPGTQLHLKPLSSWLVLQIQEARLQHHFEEFTGQPYTRKFMLAPTSFRDGDVQSLYQTLREAEMDLKTALPAERSILARAYKALVLAKLFVTVPHNLTRALDHQKLKDAPRQVLNAEAFMRASLHKPIRLKDLAKAAGCSSRALQRMFHKYRGATPMAILCGYRLAAAQGVIEQGLIESITDLAMDFQFSSLGRFSALYRRAYGANPSTDLRNARNRKEAASFSSVI